MERAKIWRIRPFWAGLSGRRLRPRAWPPQPPAFWAEGGAMPLSPELVLALAAQCAPGVAPSTLLAVARAESALDPFAIGVNGPAVRRGRARSTVEAVSI